MLEEKISKDKMSKDKLSQDKAEQRLNAKGTKHEQNATKSIGALEHS